MPRPRCSTHFPYTTLFRSLLVLVLRNGDRRKGSRPANECRTTGRLGHSCNELSHTRTRSEEHTSELQSRRDLVCRLLLEKKKRTQVLAVADGVNGGEDDHR